MATPEELSRDTRVRPRRADAAVHGPVPPGERRALIPLHPGLFAGPAVFPRCWAAVTDRSIEEQDGGRRGAAFTTRTITRGASRRSRIEGRERRGGEADTFAGASITPPLYAAPAQTFGGW